MPVTPATTLGQVVEDIARKTMTWRNSYVLTAGATTSVTDAQNEQTPTARATSIQGHFLWGKTGTGAGIQVEINGYTLGVPVFNAVATGFAAADTVTRMTVRPQIILDALRRAHADWAWRFPITYPNEAIVAGSMMSPYGAFTEPFVNGVPPGWTLTGVGAVCTQELSIIPGPGIGACKLVSGAGAPATLTWTATEAMLRMLATSSTPPSPTGVRGGLGLQLLGLVRCAGAVTDGTVTLVATDMAGVATTYTWQPTAVGMWQRLKEDISVQLAYLPQALSALTVNFNAATGAKTVYLGDMALLPPGAGLGWGGGYGGGIYGYRGGYGSGGPRGQFREYDVPASLIGAQPVVYYESSYGARDYRHILDEQRGAWEPIRTDPTSAQIPKFRLKAQVPNGAHLHVDGYRMGILPALATGTIEMNAGALVTLASKLVLNQIQKSDQMMQASKDIDAEVAALLNPDVGAPQTMNQRSEQPYTVWFYTR